MRTRQVCQGEGERRGDAEMERRGDGETRRRGDGASVTASPCHPVSVSPRLRVTASPCHPVSPVSVSFYSSPAAGLYSSHESPSSLSLCQYL